MVLSQYGGPLYHQRPLSDVDLTFECPCERPANGWKWPASARSPAMRQSDFGMLSHLECVVHLDPEVSQHSTFELGMA